MGTDDGIATVRDRQFRAVVTCATCGAIATGPAAAYEPAAAFELGREFGNAGGVAGHLPCGGGVLEVTVEEIPPPAAALQEAPP